MAERTAFSFGQLADALNQKALQWGQGHNDKEHGNRKGSCKAINPTYYTAAFFA